MYFFQKVNFLRLLLLNQIHGVLHTKWLKQKDVKLYENNVAKTDLVRVSRYEVRNIKNIKLSCKSNTFVHYAKKHVVFCDKPENEEHNNIFQN